MELKNTVRARDQSNWVLFIQIRSLQKFPLKVYIPILTNTVYQLHASLTELSIPDKRLLITSLTRSISYK